MNIIIKNTGTTDIKLYSIFPGNINIPLLLTSEQFYDRYILDYERVPLLFGESNVPSETIYLQRLGQWIYFRQTNPYSKKDYYYNNHNINQNDLNILNITSNRLGATGNYEELSEDEIKQYSCKFSTVYLPSNYNTDKPDELNELTSEGYLKKDNKQVLLGYRSRSNTINKANVKYKWQTISKNGNSYVVNKSDLNIEEDYGVKDINDKYNKLNNKFFIPITENQRNNNYLLCYEHIVKTKTNNNSTKYIYLSENDNISSFITDNNTSITGFSDINACTGAFFIPKLVTENDLLCDKFTTNQYKELQVGKSLSIPVIFEYYLNEETSKITKTIAFDLKSSPIRNLDHYIISVTANLNNNYTIYNYE